MADNPINPELASQVFVREQRMLKALALSIVNNHSIAEEVVQESWLRWHEREYPCEKARAIFRRIVYNLSIDWRRSEAREQSAREVHQLDQEDGFDSERLVIARQDLARVVAALHTLPAKPFLALKMHRIDGLTYRQIGDRLEVNHVRAFQLVAKALARAARALEEGN